MTLKPYYRGRGQIIYLGHTPDVLSELPADFVQTIVTSPPYYGAREYETPLQVWDGVSNCTHRWRTQNLYRNGSPRASSSKSAWSGPGPENAQRVRDGRWNEVTVCDVCNAWLGELGQEPHPSMYVRHLQSVLDLCHRLLKEDGTLWLNLGDSHAGGNTGNQSNVGQRYRKGDVTPPAMRKDSIPGMNKQLLLIPHRVAIAMQDSALWTIRNDVIWQKPNGMPESATDRLTKSHEHVIFASKQEHYFYNADAIAEPTTGNAHPRRKHVTKAYVDAKGQSLYKSPTSSQDRGVRNRRDVWTIPPENLPEIEHYAIMPLRLAQICLLAGARPGDVVLDPFCGAGTTLVAAAALGMAGIGIELSERSAEVAARRIDDAPTSLSLTDKPSIDIDSEEWWDE